MRVFGVTLFLLAASASLLMKGVSSLEMNAGYRAGKVTLLDHLNMV